jgi:hypothetical protein
MASDEVAPQPQFIALFALEAMARLSTPCGAKATFFLVV